MTPVAAESQLILYESPDGEARVDVRLAGETVWLTQRQMSELFETTPENVLMHLKNVFSGNELEEPATTKDLLVVRTEGKRKVRRCTEHCNPDGISSGGDRVSSRRMFGFQQSTTRTL